MVGDCVQVMLEWAEGCVDLNVISPPYDQLHDHQGYDFDFENIAAAPYRVTKEDGVVVWIVGDRIHVGRTLTSFRQGIFFQELGLLSTTSRSARSRTHRFHIADTGLPAGLGRRVPGRREFQVDSHPLLGAAPRSLTVAFGLQLRHRLVHAAVDLALKHYERP